MQTTESTKAGERTHQTCGQFCRNRFLIAWQYFVHSTILVLIGRRQFDGKDWAQSVASEWNMYQFIFCLGDYGAKKWSVVRKYSDWLLYRNNRLVLGVSRNTVPRGGWVARLNLFGGAGIHVCGSRIRGFTVFAAFKSGSRRWVNRHRGGHNPWTGRFYSFFTRLTNVELGITRKGSAVPHTSH